jgi:hypothetical protein
MQPSTAKAWAIIILSISGLALLFFGVNFVYGVMIGISLFSKATAGIISLIACILFWLAMYANALIGRSSMVLLSCAIVSEKGVERWIRRQTRIWNSEIRPDQSIVPRSNYSRTVNVQYRIGENTLQFQLEIDADFRSDTVLSKFAPYIIGSDSISHSIKEKVEAIVFDMVTKKRKDYERYNNIRSLGQQEAFNRQVNHDLKEALESVGLKLTKASFA